MGYKQTISGRALSRHKKSEEATRSGKNNTDARLTQHRSWLHHFEPRPECANTGKKAEKGKEREESVWVGRLEVRQTLICRVSVSTPNADLVDVSQRDNYRAS